MIEDKYINLKEAFALITKLINDDNLREEDRITLYQLRDKISDSDTFAMKFQEEFNRTKANINSIYLDKIENRQPIKLECRFELKPVGQNWILYHHGEIYLDELAPKIAHKICKDINVAFLIRNSRLRKSKVLDN